MTFFTRLPAKMSVLFAFSMSTVLLAACSDGGGMPNMPRWGGFGGGDQRQAAPPQPAQQAVQAAPSDVLLACTQAAASRFGGPPGSITPSGSSLVRQDTFQVNLTSTTGPIVCPGRPWWQHPSGREGRTHTAARHGPGIQSKTAVIETRSFNRPRAQTFPSKRQAIHQPGYG
jgi:hypothetical protein